MSSQKQLNATFGNLSYDKKQPEVQDKLIGQQYSFSERTFK